MKKVLLIAAIAMGLISAYSCDPETTAENEELHIQSPDKDKIDPPGDNGDNG